YEKRQRGDVELLYPGRKLRGACKLVRGEVAWSPRCLSARVTFKMG
ncbi:hypothetical protein Tco_1325966, partial [Tanacetum coccineum]